MRSSTLEFISVIRNSAPQLGVEALEVCSRSFVISEVAEREDVHGDVLCVGVFDLLKQDRGGGFVVDVCGSTSAFSDVAGSKQDADWLLRPNLTSVTGQNNRCDNGCDAI